MTYNNDYLTGAEAAALLGIARRNVYRWAHAGRIAFPFSYSDILRRLPVKRQRGPKRKRYSVRYVAGRHAFTGRNWQKASG